MKKFIAIFVVMLFAAGSAQAVTINNALRHTGYHKTPDADMYLHNNGGLLAMTPYGTALLTDGPGGRGLDFNNDADFMNTGAINQADNYMNLFFGWFNAPLSGSYGFRNDGDDDRCGIWLDLNQNGVFESSTDGLGSDRFEQLSWEDGGMKTVTLTDGQSYMFAVTHGEITGGSFVDVRFTAPGGPEVIIKPSDPAQAGMWTTILEEPAPLVAHWKLDESSGDTAYDSSGYSHGALEPSPTLTPPLWQPAGGWFNGALQLDGVDDYVDCGNDDSLNITDRITLAVWVKTNDAGNGEFNPYVTKGDRSYAIKHRSSNQIEFCIYDSGWHSVWFPVDGSFNDDWHHLAGTYNGIQLILYVDGVSYFSSYSGSIAGSAFNVNIGRNAEVTDRLYEGLIDDVAIFSRALDHTEIEMLQTNVGALFIGDPTLSALWELDESGGAIAYDSSGNGIDGTLEPAPTLTPPLWQPAGGWFNGALQLDGVDDYVDCGNDDRLNITDEITLAVWVKTNDSGNGQFNPYVSKGNQSYGLKHQDSNNIEFVIYDDWWYYVWFSVDTSFNDDWHHLAGTYDGSQLKLYVDGELEANSPYEGSIAGSTFNVNIGRNAEITDRFYDGLIDDVVIFSRALDGTEITDLKNNGGASFIGDPNLSALWELDESSGVTAYDSSGNGIDGSLEPSSPLWQPAGGQLDGALEFDGFNDCVFIPNESRFDITNQVTVSAWIKVNAFERDWQSVVTKGDSAWRLHRLRDTNSIAFHCNLYPDSWGAEGSINVNNGQWHHVAGVYDETQAYLYVDGVLDNSEAAVGLIGTNDYPVMIGENAEQPGRFWNGLIDDVRIYTCALGPSEVYQLYSNICYVDADAIGNNNGSSWTDAFNYLQDALAAQAKTLCEIRVAQGTYKPDANSSNQSGDRAATFQLINGVILKGGYAGIGQPDPNARDCDLYETTLSGNINTPGDDTDNCYHVVTSSECDLNTVLEGFTITGGYANGSFPHDSGAGMLNSGSSPAVTNCTFTSNTASSNGGGMLNYYNSNPTVTNCTFTGNTVSNSGGGMYNYSGSDPNVTNCIFTGNQAEWGGGMLNYNSNPELTDCTFTSNTASSNGGGMLNGYLSSPTVTNCTFSNNTAHSGHLGGGGMFNYENSSPTVTNCTFTGNTTTEFGGGMFNAWGSNPTVTDCTFSNNIADSNGGGMYNYASNPTVTNSILWGNIAQTGPQIYGGSPTVTYSNVEGGWGGTGNIDADPCFVDANNPDPNLRNLRLAPGSPCIDAGDNTAVPASVLKDLAGKLRYADDPCTPDTGNAGMTGRPVVDMGAYEFQGCGTTSQNLLANPGFEVGDATGWVTNWGFNLTADPNEVHDGNYSGLASGRTASWQGAWQSLLGLMDDGKTYRISGWVMLQNATSDYVALTVAQTDSAGAHYHGIDNGTGTDEQWVHLDGTLALDVVGELTGLHIYFEGPAPGINFYVDDAAVTEVMGDMNHNGGVDFIDFSLFASYYGFDCSTQDCGRANLNDCDNTINELDLLIFCNNWLAGIEP